MFIIIIKKQIKITRVILLWFCFDYKKLYNKKQIL